jgi:hypothetical protein
VKLRAQAAHQEKTSERVCGIESKINETRWQAEQVGFAAPTFSWIGSSIG